MICEYITKSKYRTIPDPMKLNSDIETHNGRI